MYFYRLFNLKMSDVNVSAVYDKVTITYNIQSLPPDIKFHTTVQLYFIQASDYTKQVKYSN